MKKVGKKIVGQVLIFHILYENFYSTRGPRLGISVSKQFGDAHLRNRFKRRVREVFRKLQHQLPPFLVHVSPKNGIIPTSQQILEDFTHAQ